MKQVIDWDFVNYCWENLIEKHKMVDNYGVLTGKERL